MYIEREIKEKFSNLAKHYKLISLVGPRQAGKTTFLKHQMDEKSSYLLFDDPDVRALFEEDIKKFEIQYIKNKELTVFDEIQYCDGAGQNLKYLVDTDNKIWITSSSEAILSKEVLSYLVGRVSILRLYPFSIKEFLRAKGQKAFIPEILKRHIWEHTTYGGYPEVVLSNGIDAKKTILKNLCETMLLKDIVRTFSIDDSRSLEKLVKYFAITTGGLISYDRIANTLNISFQTIKKYIDAMVKSYLIIEITPFFTNKAKEIVKQPKIYFMDTGLRNVITDDFSTELEGKLFENYVLTELIKNGITPKYWRTQTKAEVDFIIDLYKRPIPIEVKLHATPNKIERSLRSFINAYSPTVAYVVFYDGTPGEMNVNGCKVIFTDVLGFLEKLKNNV